MAKVVYTKEVQDFAQKFDGGLASLGATVEAELERECGLPGGDDYIPFSEFMFHCFSWHGDLNMIMFPEGEDIVVDMIDGEDDDGDGGIEIERSPVANIEETAPVSITFM